MSDDEFCNLVEFNRRRKPEDDLTKAYSCEICGKKYMSQPAVNNHKKAKHPDKIDPNEEKRGRGRPKKITLFPNDPDALKWENFYLSEQNKPQENEDPIDINEVVSSVFTDIFELNITKCYSHPNNVMDHPILELLVKNEVIQTKKEVRSINEVFYEYLLFAKLLANKYCFTLQLKFVLLFKECIDKIKKEETGDDEYTLSNNVEYLPEMCNVFCEGFLDVNSYFGMNNEEQNKIIDILQHFCYWLFKYDYTTTRIKLVSP
jgi:hypothetical protein